MPPTSPGFPYGTRSEAEIAARVPALLGRLAERYRPRLIVIACNTASTIALAAVRAALDLPIVGTVPAIKPAAALSRNARDRRARHRGDGAPALCRRSGRASSPRDCTVLRHGSAALVELAEAKLRGEATDPARRTRAVLAGLLGQPGGERIDAVVLACTHFPLLADELAAAAPRTFAFVDGGAGHRAAHRLSDAGRPGPTRRRPGHRRVHPARRCRDAALARRPGRAMASIGSRRCEPAVRNRPRWHAPAHEP